MEAFIMSVTLLEGMVIGGVGGTIAGLTIWLIQLLKDYVTKQADKKTVYNTLEKMTKTTIIKPLFVSTIDLVAYTNLTKDRVRYICFIHEKIIHKTEYDTILVYDTEKGYNTKEPLEEEWAIRDRYNEFKRRGPDEFE